MIFALLFGALPPTQARCSDADIVETYREAHNRVPTARYPPGAKPDEEAARQAATFTGLEIVPVTGGLHAVATETVDWPIACTVPLTDASGANLGALDDGRVLHGVGFKRLMLVPSRGDAEPDLPHPTVRAGTFVGSTSLVSGAWRAGIWRFADGRSLLAAYRPGTSDPPIPLLRFAHPALGVTYLPAPDSFGGAFTLLERLGHNRYRWLTAGWDERAIR